MAGWSRIRDEGMGGGSRDESEAEGFVNSAARQEGVGERRPYAEKAD